MSPRFKSRLLATQSDERLVLLVRAGHEPAFEALVHRYRKPLLRYCRRLSLSETRAEEILQQALTNAWIALRRQAEVQDVRPWLYRIAHNAAVNALRREPAASIETLPEGCSEAEADALAAPSAGMPSLDEVLALRDALAGMAALPQMQREVMVRTAVGGHSHTEVASALGISTGAVRGLLYRARATLRASVTAITPTPLLAWAADAGGSSGERVVELAAGGGTVGIAGIAAKTAVIAVTAGVAVTGAVVAHGGARHHVHRAAASIATKKQIASTGVATRPASGAAAALGRGARLPTPPHRTAPPAGGRMRADGLRRLRRITGAKDDARSASPSDAPAPRVDRQQAALPAAGGEMQRHRHGGSSQGDQGHSEAASEASAAASEDSAGDASNGHGQGRGEGERRRTRGRDGGEAPHEGERPHARGRDGGGEAPHEGQDGGESRRGDLGESARANGGGEG